MGVPGGAAGTGAPQLYVMNGGIAPPAPQMVDAAAYYVAMYGMLPPGSPSPLSAAAHEQMQTTAAVTAATLSSGRPGDAPTTEDTSIPTQ
jgi:hypothetical protein